MKIKHEKQALMLITSILKRSMLNKIVVITDKVITTVETNKETGFKWLVTYRFDQTGYRYVVKSTEMIWGDSNV